jgi:hypothetical protein
VITTVARLYRFALRLDVRKVTLRFILTGERSQQFQTPQQDPMLGPYQWAADGRDPIAKNEATANAITTYRMTLLIPFVWPYNTKR